MNYLIYVIGLFIFYSIFIYMIHYIYYYMKENYISNTKIDVFEIQKKKYQEVIDVLSSKQPIQEITVQQNEKNSYQYLQDSLLDVLNEEL